MKNGRSTARALCAACTSLVLFVVTSPARADWYVKTHVHTDEYYDDGVVNPAEDRDVEMWYGSKKTAYVSSRRIVIVDLNRNALVFANKDDSTYVETTLPFQWPSVVAEELLGFLARYQRQGTVTATDETKEIRGRKCRCYIVASWIDTEGGRYDEREERIWTTEDLPLDWKALSEITRNNLRLQNYGDALLESLVAVPGVSVGTEAEIYFTGFSVKSTEQVVEFQEKKPPADVYALPGYFKRKAQLTMQDLRG